MANNIKHYKEINELLRKFDLEIQRVKEGLNKSPSHEFGIDFTNNSIGINRENIDSILTALRKNNILKSNTRITDKGVIFSAMGLNVDLINEIKHYHNFNLKSYEDKANMPLTLSKTSNIIAGLAALFTILAFFKSCYDKNDIDEKLNSANKRIDSLVNVHTKKADTMKVQLSPQKK
jgi:hypothetical protein